MHACSVCALPYATDATQSLKEGLKYDASVKTLTLH